MNPLTREVLLTLVDEASDEQIISAIETPSTSVVLFRFLLKQYLIQLTSIPGNKLDHNATILEWSQMLGYVALEEKRKRATISTQAERQSSSDTHTTDEDDTDSSAAAQEARYSAANINIPPHAQNMNANSLKVASPFGISPRSTIRTSNANLDGAFNLFRTQQETIAEETEEDEFDETAATSKYDAVKLRPITPPMFSLTSQEPPALSTSSSGTESETPDFDKDMSSFAADYTPRGTTFRTINHTANNRATAKSIMEQNIDVRLLNMESKMSKTYDLSDDDEDEMMVELDTNLNKLGHFRATLFMRLWLNITQYLHQTDKLCALQLVSKKFRAIALAANHWTNVEIKVDKIQQGEWRKLQRFLDTIHAHVERVTISHVSMHDAYDISAVLRCIPKHIKALIVHSGDGTGEYKLPRFNVTQFMDLEELRLYGCMIDCNWIREMHQLRVLCFDSNSEKQQKCTVLLPDQLMELCMPYSVSTEWFTQCLKADKLSKLKVLTQYDLCAADHKEERLLSAIYEDHGFEYGILQLIAHHCVDIEYISIHCKLQKEFGETLKYVLSHCPHLQFIA